MIHNNLQKNELNKEPIFNANWQKAALHGRAQLVGYPSQQIRAQRCECCLQQIHKKHIPLTQNTKQLQFLGFGLPLYFAFIRNCIFLLIITVCTNNLISMYRGVLQNIQVCSKHDPANAPAQATSHQLQYSHSKFLVKQLDHNNSHSSKARYDERHFTQISQQQVSLPKQKSSVRQQEQKSATPQQANKQQQQQQQSEDPLRCKSWMLYISRISKQVQSAEILIRLATFFIHLLLLIYIRDKLVKMKNYFDERYTSPSDYSLLFNNLPLNANNLRNTLLQKLKTQLKTNSIAQILLIPENKRFQELQTKKNKSIERLRELYKQKKLDKVKEVEHQIENLENQLKKIVAEEKLKYRKDDLHAQRAIVIVNSKKQKQNLLQEYQDKGLEDEGDVKWSKVRIQEAPQPKQIIWENIYISQGTRSALITTGWMLSIFVLMAITVVFAIVSTKKSKIVQEQAQMYKQTHNIFQKYKEMFIVYGMIFFVVLFNKLGISLLFHKFTDWERHSNNYKFQISFCLKYCLGLFFTTALMTLIVQAFIFKNYYQTDYGVIEEQTIMFMINSMFVPLFWLINPVYQFKRLKQKTHFGKKQYTQQQANMVMENPSYDVGKRYGQILQVMWFTYLYMTLIPVGGVFSVIGLSLYYWIDKYNLLRRSSLLSNVPGQLIILTLKMLDVTLVLRVLGELIFDYQIRKGPLVTSWICLGIAVIYQFLPINRLIQIFNHETFKTEEKTYTQVSKTFEDSYYNKHFLFSYLKQDKQQLLREIKERSELYKTKLKILTT